eukprot:Nitzschia sp. Nitz4//NODE_464_length_17123_cov_69.824057//13594//16854//NITZ4_additional_000066-RA//-1//CDS//3329531924//5807//frame0
MILGKSWTSLPSDTFPNPTVWLVDQIHKLYENANIPKGSVIVAATDTLISFARTVGGPSSPVQWDLNEGEDSLVLGVAVPAVVSTAKNHGVYVMSQQVTSRWTMTVESPSQVWQKPPESLLTNDPEASFQKPGYSKDLKFAWIDTGVVVFLPKAVLVLRELSKEDWALCTRHGIRAAYESDLAPASTKGSLEQYAQKHALKIDLYTDILHNLSWPGKDTPSGSLLSSLSLKIIVAPEGQFLHLGTTQELLDWVTTNVYNSQQNKAMLDFDFQLADYFALKPRHLCTNVPDPAQDVCLYSKFPQICNATIGEGSLVEYCNLEDYEYVRVGCGSLLSGWRNPTRNSSPLNIPDNLAVQQISVRQTNGEQMMTFMVLGTKDGVKTARVDAALFGLPTEVFLLRTGLNLHDIGWSEGADTVDNIWTAKIHPIVPEGTAFDSVCGWIHALVSSNRPILGDSRLQCWLKTPRVSLKELHSLADAEREWSFRLQLEADIQLQLQNDLSVYLHNVLHRDDQFCDLHWMMGLSTNEFASDLVLKALTIIENTALEILPLGQYPRCGRCFVVASALLADFAQCRGSASTSGDNASLAFYTPKLEALRSMYTMADSLSDRVELLNEIIQYRRSESTETFLKNLFVLSNVMEHLATCMTELSIAAGFHKVEMVHSSNKETPVKNRWVLAVSPARVDMGGGWSDTPPVCYEFGGAVTGAAVAVDHHLPLSCRSRIRTGHRGIAIRTESRNLTDGSLLSARDVFIDSLSAMKGFRDPLADGTLVQCALRCLGMVCEDDLQHESGDIQPFVNKFCHSTEDVGLEIVTTSLLPHGSGMGSSSILATCILKSVASCIGREVNDQYLLHGVLMVEQLLTTGGGWQDQALAMVGGVKTVVSKGGTIPMEIEVQHLPMSNDALTSFNQRLMLVYTGKTRLAKNLLQDVLRRWARRTSQIMKTTSENVKLATSIRQSIQHQQWKECGGQLVEYLHIKCRMVGEESITMPAPCLFFVRALEEQCLIDGACLCGAGGGGFMIVLLADGIQGNKVREALHHLIPACQGLSSFTIHDCHICQEGMRTTVLEEATLGMHDFALEWHDEIISG